MVHWKRYLPTLLIVMGTGTIAAAISADFVGIGDRASFGSAQRTLTLVGGVALLSGVGYVTPAVRRGLRALRSKGKANLLLPLASFALTIAVGELALRWDGRFSPPPYPPRCTMEPQWCALYQEFKPHGYRLWPSRTASYLYPPHNPRNLTVVSNKHGFRSSREFDEPDARTRIVVVGDSFVFGEGVEEIERFTNVLEMIQPTWRVDNMGMTGYSLDLMLRALEEVGLNLEPDVVMFAVYTDDFRRIYPHYAGMGYRVLRFKLRSGQLVTVPYPEPRPWDRLHIVQALSHAYWGAAQWALNEAILDRFVDLADLHSFVPVIVFLPGTDDTPADKQRRAWLQECALKRGVPFLDLSERIHAAGRRVFIQGNPHYNPHGHQIVAEELYAFLAEQVLSDR